MNFDFKITTWERVTLDPKYEQKILQDIKDGKITTANDIFTLNDPDNMNIECNVIIGIEETMSIEDNDGYATLEVVGDKGEQIYKNGK